ncbi:MAG: PPC domain-containing DNA-binding protein, partial [Chloroflexota bacterium]
MHVRRLNNIDPEVYAVIFETGDEFMTGLNQAAREFKLTASHFSGIGAFSDLELVYFDWEAKEYQPIPQMSEQVEVLTLAGDIAISDGEP